MKHGFLLGLAVVLSMFASQSCSDDQAKAGSTFKWPYSAVDSQGALDEELAFFDDC